MSERLVGLHIEDVIMARARAKSASNKPVTKTEAVRQVLAELGKTAAPDAAIALVKDKFGHDLTKSHFFNIKSTLGLGSRGKRRGKKRGRPHKSEATAVAAPSVAAARPAAGVNFAVADIAILCDLVSRLGAGALQSLVDLVS